MIQASHTFWATHAFAQTYVDPAGPAYHCVLLNRLAVDHGNRFAETYEKDLREWLVLQRSTPHVSLDLNDACFYLNKEIFQRLEFQATARYSKSGRDRHPPEGGPTAKAAKAKARADAAKATKLAVSAQRRVNGVDKAIVKTKVTKGAGKNRAGPAKIDEPCNLFAQGICKMEDRCRRQH